MTRFDFMCLKTFHLLDRRPVCTAAGPCALHGVPASALAGSLCVTQSKKQQSRWGELRTNLRLTAVPAAHACRQIAMTARVTATTSFFALSGPAGLYSSYIFHLPSPNLSMKQRRVAFVSVILPSPVGVNGIITHTVNLLPNSKTGRVES